MITRLKRTYAIQLAPAIAGFIFAFYNRRVVLVDPDSLDLPDMLPGIIFILSIACAIALPILYRAYFASKIRHQTWTPETDWIKFEQNLIHLALATPYLSVCAYILQFPKIHLSGSILATLYAIYYFYPSTNRIAFERRIFRVRKIEHQE